MSGEGWESGLEGIGVDVRKGQEGSLLDGENLTIVQPRSKNRNPLQSDGYGNVALATLIHFKISAGQYRRRSQHLPAKLEHDRMLVSSTNTPLTLLVKISS